MRKLLPLFLFVGALIGIPSLHAEDIYAGHASAGAATGANCSNRVAAASFFNNSSNWGAGAGKISPGDTFHICQSETLTVADKLIFQGSGSAGNVIWLQFDANAKMSAATWGNGSGGLAISIPNGSSYLKITGTTSCGYVAAVHIVCTEYIEATANGSNLANQDDDTGIFCRFCNHVEIANLGGYNMFVQRQADTHYAQHGTAFQIGGSDDHIHHTDVVEAYTGIEIDYNASAANIEMDHNSAHRTNFAIVGSPFGNNTHANGYLIHDNEAYDWQNWDDVAGNCCHHNGVILPTQGTNTDNTGIDGLQIYNNYWHGDSGGFMTAHIFLDCEEVGDYCFPGSKFYNNIHVAGAGGNSPNNGFMSIGSANNLTYTISVYNNTFYYISQLGGRCIQGSGAAWTFKNNTFLNCGQVYYTQTSSSQLVASDYNNFWIPTSGAAPMTYFGPDGSTNQTFAAYKTATGFDAHSTNVTPNYNTTTFVPNSGSPLITAGLNLTSLGITPLNVDFYSVSRPGGVAPWDVGCCQFAAGGSPAVSLSPTSIAFGSVTVSTTTGNSTITLTNSGGALLTYSSIAKGGTDTTKFTLTTGTCPLGGSTLAAGASCTVLVAFTPTAAVSYSANITFTSDAASSPNTVALTGSGVAASQGGGGTGGSSGTGGTTQIAKFSVGDTFKVNSGGGRLNVRSAPNASAPIIANINNGSLGTIIGPTAVFSVENWWQINTKNGFVVERLIRQ